MVKKDSGPEFYPEADKDEAEDKAEDEPKNLVENSEPGQPNVDLGEDPTEYVVYTDENGEQQRITREEYQEKGLDQ